MNFTDNELQMIEDGLVELWEKNYPFHKKQEIEDLTQRITDERIRITVTNHAREF